MQRPRATKRAKKLSQTCGAALLLAAAATGCAHAASAEERQLAELRSEIARVQADRDKFEQRVTQLELQGGSGKSNAAPASVDANGKPIETPKLRIVRLTPDGREVTEDAPAPAPASPVHDEADDDGPRPTIRINGAPTAPGRRGSPVRGPDLIEQTLPEEAPSRPSTPRPSALDPEAKRAYDAALALVNGRQFPQALEAFAAFLVRWPDHPYADNATYWRGEAYFAQGEYVRAAEQFEGTIARFPMGNKVSDALLKLGICHQKLGNPQKARGYFERLQKEHPRSDAAKRIPQESK